MPPGSAIGCVLMFLLPAGEKPENPWTARVGAAVSQAKASGSPLDLAAALDVAYRADDWQAGRALAERALPLLDKAPTLPGLASRAFWRAGAPQRAVEALRVREPTRLEPLALLMDAQIAMARGRLDDAFRLADRLEADRTAGAGVADSAYALFTLASLRLSQDRLDGLPDLLRQAQQRIDPAQGYPDVHLGDMLNGLPEFFDAAGDEPINELTAFGRAEMPLMGGWRLPYVLATIDGHGPYRLIVDSGGSIALSLDARIADEIGLRSIATASVRGVGGRQDSGQALVGELAFGDVRCRRVLTRAFDLPEPINHAAEGIVGGGLFDRARVTFDFASAELVVARPGDRPGGAAEADARLENGAALDDGAPLWIVGDGKLLLPIRVQGRERLALLDSGADVIALAPSLAAELFPDQPLAKLGGAGLGVGVDQDMGITLAPPLDIELFGRRLEQQAAVGLEALDSILGPILGVQTHVIIGMPVLRQMRSLTIDYPNSRAGARWLRAAE